jgi:hypothetical protein
MEMIRFRWVCYNRFMQNWNLAAGDPLALTLAADARLTLTNYTDDQIWELSLSGGEPAALALQTTYGLRAHWMRLFPRFVRGDVQRTDPASFHAPPRILRFYPNTLSITFEPFEGLEVLAEYWIPDSQAACGRIKITNHSILPQNFRLEWVALLNPIDRQGGMVAVPSGPSHVLAGETSRLHPVVYMTGGPQSTDGPYPALALDMELYPGNSRQFSWASVAMSSFESSLDAARLATARPWEAEQARIELLNQSQSVQVQTGDPDWDTAFALTQKTAFGLLFKSASSLPNPSFVLSRRPDQGFSVRGDGSDYSHLWSGQTALDTYYLSSLLLPGASELVAGILRNFLSVQGENGMIDWKPGLGGQRSRRMAQPLLATLAVQVAPYMAQLEWYQEVFPRLLRFFDTWFSPLYDQDGDGFPEWEHPLQTGMEDSPIFDRWSPTAQGIDISRMEAPGLAAMLYRECQSLIEMATFLENAERASAAYARLSGSDSRLSGAAEALPVLRERETALRNMVESTWDTRSRTYRYRDYQTHLSPPGQTLVKFIGPGKATSRKRFSQPRRLAVQLQTTEERTYALTINIYGFTAGGETCETLSAHSFSWMGKHARATTQNTFLALKRVEAIGVGEEDQVHILAADYTQEDASLLLPLWAGVPEAELAHQAIEDTLQNRYLLDYGIPPCPQKFLPQEELPGLHSALSSALLPWNQLIGEGLLRYGYRELAAGLVTRLMSAVVASLKNHQDFRQYYHAETGLAAGERGHLHGLAPLGLFLQTLGIRQFGPKEILLDGFNPFPWIINVQYRKVLLTFYPDKTEIQFPGGQKVTIDRPGLHRVTLT